MKINVIVLLGMLFLWITCQTENINDEIKVTDLKCEYLKNPIGIDVVQPRLGWVIKSTVHNQKQTAFQILVASSPEQLDENQADIWNSGKVESEQSIHVVYQGPPLESRQRCWWKVRVWDRDNRVSVYSDPAFWEMGLLNKRDWQADWIQAPRVYDWSRVTANYRQMEKSDPQKNYESAPYLRTFWQTENEIKQARLYISGLGYYEVYLNGARIGDHVLDPAFTNYDKRVLYVTYDVTDQLKTGQNVMGVLLGDGWYNMHCRAVWGFEHAPWRERPSLLCQLEIELEDGSKQIIVSDSTWKAAPSPIIYNCIRQGEIYDARKEKPGWSNAQYDVSDWADVRVECGPKGKLDAQMLPPIRATKSIQPKTMTEPKPGVYVFDMGQNFAGWIQLKVKGPAGTRITMKYGEILHPDGTVDQSNIDRHHREETFHTAEYILKGEGTEVWEPRFTYFGFQYVEVTGLSAEPDLQTLTGRFVHTDFEQAGSFVCSNEIINQIVHAAHWSFLSNFHGYPTDCPQREKNGWTGDAHLSGETGLLMFKPQAGYTKWLNDCKDAQLETGQLPGIVPTSGWGYSFGKDYRTDRTFGFGPAWDGAYIWLAWYMYLYSGDTAILATHYPQLKKCIEFFTSHAPDHILSIGLGDWVFVDTWTPVEVTSTACYYDLTLKMGRIADILGYEQDANVYRERAKQIRTAFNEQFYHPDQQTYANSEQTALGCALFQELVPENDVLPVANTLAQTIEANQGLLDCGVLGAKYIPHALSDHGQPELAYQITTETRYPSWGFWMINGATTLWEDFNIQSKDNSHNHMFFGDVVHWYFKELAGIRPDPEQPGFKHIIIKPYLPADLDWVNAEHRCMYGLIKSAWKRKNNQIVFDIEIPVNTHATLYIPAVSDQDVTYKEKPLADSPLFDILAVRENHVILKLGSGQYQFISKL